MLAQDEGRDACERHARLGRDSCLLGLLGRVGVEAGVLDRHGRHSGQQHEDPLVLVREHPVGRLGQVEVAEDAAAPLDRHAEERSHGRMVRRKADRARVVREIAEPQRAGLVDQDAEDAATRRQRPEQLALVGGEAGRDEARDPAVGPEHAEGAVGRAREACRRLDDGLQRLVEIEALRDRHPGLDDLRELVLRQRCGHRSSGSHRLLVRARAGRTERYAALS